MPETLRNESDELKLLVERYARGDLTDEDFLRQVEMHRLDIRERRRTEEERQEAVLIRAHAAIRRIGRL